MDIVTSIPVRLNREEAIASLLESVRQRVAARAYDNYLDGGCLEGRELDDWLDAERELVIKPAAAVSTDDKDVIVEMILPEIDLPHLAVHIAPRQLVISSAPDRDGLQLCQTIDLPCEISLDGVDAEQLHNMLRITAARLDTLSEVN